MLTALRDYLAGRGQASLAEIALHFDLDPELARQILEVWMRKGKVERRQATAACGTQCSQCDPAAVELYRWRDAEAPAAAVECPAPQEKGG